MRKLSLWGKTVAATIVAALVMVLLVVPMVPGTSVAFAADEDDQTERIILDITSQEGRWDYWTGEVANLRASYALSGATLNLPNARLELTVKDVDPEQKFRHTVSFGALSGAQTEDISSGGVRGKSFTYDNMHGGQEGSVPLSVTFYNHTVRDGSQVEVTLKLIDENGDERATVTRILTAKAGGTIEPMKTVYNCPQHKMLDNGDTECYVDYASDDGSIPQTFTVSEWQSSQSPYVVNYCIGFRHTPDPNAPEGKGIYSGRSLKFIDTLPAGMKLAPEVREWRYVDGSTTQIERYVELGGNGLPLYGKYDCGNKNDTFGFQVPVVANDAVAKNNGVQVRHENTVNLIRDYGIEDQAQDLGTASASLVFKAERTTPDGEIFLEKRKFGNGDFTFRGDRVLGSDGERFFLDQDNDQWQHFGYALDVRQKNVTNPTEENFAKHPHIGKLSSVTDFGLDSRLYYQRIMLVEHATLKSVTYNRSVMLQQLVDDARPFVYGVKADGTEVKLHEQPLSLTAGNRIVNINDTARQYVKLIVRFENPLIMDNSALRFYVDTPPTAAERQKWEAGGYNDQGQRAQYINKMEALALIPDTNEQLLLEEPAANLSNNYLVLRDISTELGMLTSGDHTVNWYPCAPPLENESWAQCDNVREYSMTMRPHREWTAETIAKNFKQIILLPEGVEFYGFPARSLETVKVDAAVVPNFADTGKRALVLSYGDMPKDKLQTLTTKINLDATLLTSPGLHNIPVYATWDNREEITPAVPALDTNDVSLDGRRDDYVLQGNFTLRFRAPEDVQLLKQVSADSITWKSALHQREIDTDLYYRLQVANLIDRPQNRLTVIDVLPHSRDTRIIANQAGEYTPRQKVINRPPQLGDGPDLIPGEYYVVDHSQFDTPMTQPIESIVSVINGVRADASDRFEVTYSTVLQSGGFETIRDGQWLTADQITDWSTVRNFRVTLRPGQIIAPREQILIVSKHHIPLDDRSKAAASGKDQRSFNSAAMSLNGTLFNESNEVYTTLVDYTVSGKFYWDASLNNHEDYDDAPLANRTVALVDAKTGSVVKDLHGQPYLAQTDKNGTFTFTVHRAGEYRVVFVKESDERYLDPHWAVVGSPDHHVLLCTNNFAQDGVDFTALQSAQCQPEASAANNVGYTPVFKLDVKQRQHSVKAGVQKDDLIGDAIIEKRETGENGFLPGAKFELTWKRPLYFGDKEIAPAPERIPDPVTAVSGAVTDIPGYTADEALGYAVFKNLPVGVYTLRELEAPAGYIKTEEEFEVRVYGTALSDYATVPVQAWVSNDPNPEEIAGFVRFLKQDADTQLPLPGAVFVMKKDGVEKARATSRTDGMVVFGPLPAGDYTIEELTAPEGYAKLEDTFTVSITERKTYELPDVKNNKVQTPPENPSENPQDPPNTTPNKPEDPNNPERPKDPEQPGDGGSGENPPNPQDPPKNPPVVPFWPQWPIPGGNTPVNPPVVPPTPNPGDPQEVPPVKPRVEEPADPSVNGSVKVSPKLAKTGADTQELTALAAILLASGVTLLARGRRRK